MENAKCKRGKTAGKCSKLADGQKNGAVYMRNLRNKPEKRPKKKRGKQLLSESHKCGQMVTREPLRRLSIKDGRGVDGMFFKGLRTQYVARETLGEVSKARRNEDINKIIDIGRVFFRKGKLPGRRGEGVNDLSGNRKSKKSCFAVEESSTESGQECSLSPISPPSIRPREPDDRSEPEVGRVNQTTEDDSPANRKKLDAQKELRAFSLKYEATVTAQILFKLPQNGVLEDALTALRKFHQASRDGRYIGRCSAADAPGAPSRSTPCIGQFHTSSPERERCALPFLTDDIELEDCNCQRSRLLFEERFCESFVGSPFENKFISGNLPSYLNVFDNGEKSVKKLELATPPIQFYRRNMF